MMMAVLPAAAQTGQSAVGGMVVIGRGKVVNVLSGTLIMMDNDWRYRLDNILVPSYEQLNAVAALKEAFVGKNVTLYGYAVPAGPQYTAKDKTGVTYAQVVGKNGVWAQAVLVSNGFAQAAVSPAGNGRLGELKRLEAKARQAKKGLWANAANGVKPADEAASYIGTYQIVQGKIVSVFHAKGVGNGIYFNLSQDWKNGFSIFLPSNFTSWYPLPSDPGYVLYGNIMLWQGRTVQVRGWIEQENGKPVIKVTQGAQMDVIPQNEQ